MAYYPHSQGPDANGRPPNETPSEYDPDVYDVIVLGAGLAGLAAGHALLDDDLEVVLLEARTRLGGRAQSDRQFAGFPVELGAEFIQGERSATWGWVDRLGLATAHWTNREDSWVRLADGRRLTIAQARAASPEFEAIYSWKLPALPPRPLESFEHYLQRCGFNLEQLEYARRTLATGEGESLRFLDATATLVGLEAKAFDGDEEYRILEGYGAIVEAFGVGLEILTQSVVSRVQWGPSGVVVTTREGHVYRGRSAVITLPVGVLQAGDIEFDPPLPPQKTRALAGLGMGPVAKFIYRFAEQLTPDEIHAIYAAGNPPMWWSPSATNADTEAFVWSAIASGDGAMELLRHGEEEALELALEAFRLEVGRPGLRPLEARLVDWHSDPFALGGHSYVRPGHHGAREALAEPTPPLFWAGEATAPEERAATVHGAILSGERAAVEARGALAAQSAEAESST